MRLDDFKNWKAAEVKRRRTNAFLIFALTLVTIALWVYGGGSLSPQERKLAVSVREAEDMMYQIRTEAGSEFNPEDDPYHTGFIGLEWSTQSTTLGSLPAKRTSCDPRWPVIIRRWLESLDIEEGDNVVIFSSSSFPALAFSSIAAVESLGALPVPMISLGASTWGANDPKFPWPVIENILRKNGYIHTRAIEYTYGGNAEVGQGISPEGIEIFNAAAAANGVDIYCPEGAGEREIADRKMDVLARYKPKCVICIGGSQANMGTDKAVLRLAPGLHRSGNGGSGVIGRALDAGYPVIHLLNMRGLSAACGVPFDARPGFEFGGNRSRICGIAAFAIAVIILAFYKRWSY